VTDNLVGLKAFVVVRVVVFSFPFVDAASDLAARFAAACPIVRVGKISLLLPGLSVGARLEFVRIGSLEVGVLVRVLVGLVGLNRGASWCP